MIASPYLVTPGRPVLDEFLRQVREEKYRLDLSALWDAAGRPPEEEPGRWAKTSEDAGCKRMKILRKPGGPAMADGLTAALYAIELDESIEERYYCHYRKRYKGAPGASGAVQAMIDEPTPLIAMLAVCDAMYMGDANLFRAVMDIRNALVRTVDDLDTFEQETILARAMRALRNEIDVPDRLIEELEVSFG